MDEFYRKAQKKTVTNSSFLVAQLQMFRILSNFIYSQQNHLNYGMACFVQLAIHLSVC